MKAFERLCAEVHHGLDGLPEEKEHFFGCQGRVGPFGGCCSTVMDPLGILFVSVLGETGEGVHPGIFRP